MIEENKTVKFLDIPDVRLWRAVWDARTKQMCLSYKEGKEHYPISEVASFISWMVDVREEQGGRAVVIDFAKPNSIGKPYEINQVFRILHERCSDLFSPQGYERFDDVMCPRPTPNKGGDNQEDDKDRALQDKMIKEKNRKYLTATAVSSSTTPQKGK